MIWLRLQVSEFCLLACVKVKDYWEQRNLKKLFKQWGSMEVVATTWQNVEQKQHILDRKSSQAATTRNYQKTVFRFLPTQILVLLFKSVWVFFNSFIQIVLKRETETAAVKCICKYFQFLWLKNRQEGCSSVKLFSFVCYIKDRLEDMYVLLVFCHFIIKRFPWLHFLVSN